MIQSAPPRRHHSSGRQTRLCEPGDSVTLDCLLLFDRGLDHGTKAWHVRAMVQVAARGSDGRGRAASPGLFTVTAEASQF